MTRRRWAFAVTGLALVAGVLALVLVLTGGEVDGIARILREPDSGAVVEMEPAQQVLVEVEGNPTTGFTWEVAEIDQRVIAPAGDPQYESESDADGSGGTYTFRFEVVGPGETEVVMAYRQSWTDVAPSRTFTFRVVVG